MKLARWLRQLSQPPVYLVGLYGLEVNVGNTALLEETIIATGIGTEDTRDMDLQDTSEFH